MKPRFINNLPVEKIFWVETSGSNVGTNFDDQVKLRLDLQGFAENFILQTATDQALLT
jgi:hypothetical protein